MEYLNAFLCGGILCAVGQIIIDKTQLTPARILTGYVVVGVLLSALGLYEPLAQWGGAGATVPLTGFGHTLAKGVREAVASDGWIGIFTGGLTAAAGGVTAAVVAGVSAVSVGLYAVNGAPELIGLEKAQAVYDGRADTPSIERYLESSPKDGRAWVLLARRHVDEENFPKAAEAYRRGRAANAKVKADPAVMLELAATLLTIGGPDSMREAQPLAQGAVDGRPGDMKAVEILAVAASANEDWRTAAESLSLLMSTMNPDTPEYVQYEMTLKRLRELAASQKTPLPSTSR